MLPTIPLPGTLYVVSTPIGNREDITLRALRILREVSLVACEDTRRTSLLLRHFQITTPVLSYHKFNEKKRLDKLLQSLQDGKSVALVSDAGTPSLSDPGAILIRTCRRSGIPVSAIPGASAVLAALAASPFAGEAYLFFGFLPASAGRRQKVLERLKDVPWNLVFYESPLRVRECLKDIIQILGNRIVFWGRELTKHFEETIESSAGEILSQISTREIKGEITLIVKGAAGEAVSPGNLPSAVEDARGLIQSQGFSKKEAAKRAAEQHGFSSREIYQELIKAQHM